MSEKKTSPTGASAEDGLGIKRMRQIKNKALVKKRRDQILDAAQKLFIKKGFNVTTVQDICENSGVNPGSLYDYVENKDDILRLLFIKMMGESLEEREILFPQKEFKDMDELRQFVRAAIRQAWSARPALIALAYQETRFLDSETKKKVKTSDHDLIKTMTEYIGMAVGRQVDQDRLWVAASLLVFLFGFMPLKGWTTKGIDMDTVLDAIVDLFIQGLDSL